MSHRDGDRAEVAVRGRTRSKDGRRRLVGGGRGATWSSFPWSAGSSPAGVSTKSVPLISVSAVRMTTPGATSVGMTTTGGKAPPLALAAASSRGPAAASKGTTSKAKRNRSADMAVLGRRGFGFALDDDDDDDTEADARVSELCGGRSDARGAAGFPPDVRAERALRAAVVGERLGGEPGELPPEPRAVADLEPPRVQRRVGGGGRGALRVVPRGPRPRARRGRVSAVPARGRHHRHRPGLSYVPVLRPLLARARTVGGGHEQNASPREVVRRLRRRPRRRRQTPGCQDAAA
mmetsp:Transcript_29836/g.96268  ORF Transcript_29836/g.96268 Transcript_29836/m.96268 type:complete len:292 (-) Transcript_29836:996-1871(-)